MRLCKNALQDWKIGIIFHILTSQSTNLFLKENVLCARLWILIHFDGNKEASENFKFLCSIVFEICVCVCWKFFKNYILKSIWYIKPKFHTNQYISSNSGPWSLYVNWWQLSRKWSEIWWFGIKLPKRQLGMNHKVPRIQNIREKKTKLWTKTNFVAKLSRIKLKLESNEEQFHW